MNMQPGKLYRVKALHPDAVSAPENHVFYQTIIDPKTGTVEAVEVDTKFKLEVGDVFLFLGNLNNPMPHCKGCAYITIFLGDKIWGSNVSIRLAYKYLELERVS